MSSKTRPPHGNKAVNMTLNVLLVLAAAITCYLVFVAFTATR